MRPDELERRLRERLDALGPAPRAELLHVLMLPDLERADRIGEFWGYPQSRAFAELLIDCEGIESSGRCWSGCCGKPSGGSGGGGASRHPRLVNLRRRLPLPNPPECDGQPPLPWSASLSCLRQPSSVRTF
jgi:hypothetical protein